MGGVCIMAMTPSRGNPTMLSNSALKKAQDSFPQESGAPHLESHIWLRNHVVTLDPCQGRLLASQHSVPKGRAICQASLKFDACQRMSL